MARKMDQTEERQIPRVMAVAIGNGADHHYEIHDMHLNRVWVDKVEFMVEFTKRPFTLLHADRMVACEELAEADINIPEYWMPRA